VAHTLQDRLLVFVMSGACSHKRLSKFFNRGYRGLGFGHWGIITDPAPAFKAVTTRNDSDGIETKAAAG